MPWGTGACSQSTATPLFCSYLLMLFPCIAVGSPCGLPSFKNICFSVDSPGTSIPSETIHLLWHGSFMEYGMDMCSSIVLSLGYREIPNPVPQEFLPHFFSDFDVQSFSSFLLSLCGGFFLFLNSFSQRCYQQGCGAWLWPVVGLEPEVSGTSFVLHSSVLTEAALGTLLWLPPFQPAWIPVLYI